MIKTLKYSLLGMLWSVVILPLFAEGQVTTPPSSQNAMVAITDAQLMDLGILNRGSSNRIKAVLAKAERGQDIVVGAIGGSITMGADIGTPVEGRWANLVAQWFRVKYPNIRVQLYNAGIGATNSTFGALRAYEDLLKYSPDLVVFEFSINDSQNEWLEKSSEGLLRQILTSPNQPAAIMLAMMNRWGDNVQEKHLPLAKHYELPFVSFRNVFEPKLKDSTLSYRVLLADDVHPNRLGHQMAARIVTTILEDAYQAKAEPTPGSNPLPAPLYSSMFEKVSFTRAADIRFAGSKGWNLTPHMATRAEPWRLHGKRIVDSVWNAATAGSTIDYEYQGTFFALTYFQYKLGTEAGVAKVSIDGRAVAMLNGVGQQTWGGMAQTAILGENLPFGNHKVTIEVVPNMGSTNLGNGFDLIGVGYGAK